MVGMKRGFALNPGKELQRVVNEREESQCDRDVMEAREASFPH